MRLPQLLLLAGTLAVVLAVISAGCGDDSDDGLPEIQDPQAALREALSPELETVVFAPDSAELSEGEKAELAEVGAAALPNNGAQITITGDTGETDSGSDPGLAERRAVTVRDYLSGLGISPVLMTVAVANEGVVPAARISAEGQPGAVRYERWEETGLAELAEFDFSQEPDFRADLPGMVSPINVCDQCMYELRGVLRAPRTGPYRFWLSADDEATFEISSTESPDLLAPIMQLEFGQWTEALEFDKFPRQRSRAVPLEAGKRYAIRARGHEESGADHLIVQWTPPGGRRVPIAEMFLRTGG